MTEYRIMGRKKLFEIEEVLKVIQNWIINNGNSPTLEEIQQKLNVGSKRTVSRYLQELEEFGYIERWQGARGIRIRRLPEQGINTIQVPLVGDVTAGALSLTEENIQSYFRVPEKFTRPKNATFFLLRVDGDSMNSSLIEGGTIDDGDLILVRKQPVAEHNNIVVALVDGETTIKRLKKGPGYYVLNPESNNPEHEPIIVEQDFQIQGVVLRVLKNGSEFLQHL